MEHCDILIIGAGAAGLAAAEAAWKAGCQDILLVDRKPSLGESCGNAATRDSVTV